MDSRIPCRACSTVARLQLGAQKGGLEGTQLFENRESPYRVPKGGAKQAVLRLIAVKLFTKYPRGGFGHPSYCAVCGWQLDLPGKVPAEADC
jgi:hypothetical protein